MAKSKKMAKRIWRRITTLQRRRRRTTLQRRRRRTTLQRRCSTLQRAITTLQRSRTTLQGRITTLQGRKKIKRANRTKIKTMSRFLAHKGLLSLTSSWSIWFLQIRYEVSCWCIGEQKNTILDLDDQQRANWGIKV